MIIWDCRTATMRVENLKAGRLRAYPCTGTHLVHINSKKCIVVMTYQNQEGSSTRFAEIGAPINRKATALLAIELEQNRLSYYCIKNEVAYIKSWQHRFHLPCLVFQVSESVL